MRIIQRIALFGLACLMAGCSIHPLPEDVTGVPTTEIVRKIRCEARDAVVAELLDYLHDHGYPDFTEDQLLSIKLRKWREPVKSMLPYFEDGGLVLAFTLEMAETDGVSANADIIKPLTHGVFTLTPSAGDTVIRDNLRAFTTVDNFLELITLEYDQKRYCDFTAPGPNFQYPMVGQIGLREVVHTFLSLALYNGLGKNQTDPTVQTALSRGTPAMADTLKFTTTIMAGLMGKVAFSTVGTRFQDMDATINPSVMRVDTHSVIVGLGLPVLAPVSIRGAMMPMARTALFSTQFTPALTITNPPVTTGEANAKAAVDQQILRFELGRVVPFIGP